MRIAISAGHSAKCIGAVGPAPWGLDEYTENVVMMNKIAEQLSEIAGYDVETFTDTTSTDQNTNLNKLVNWHNNTAFRGVGGDDRLDISIHFNSTEPESGTNNAIGTEVWYYSQKELAAEIATAIARASGLIDRGEKHTTSLFFLTNTDAPAVLIEVAFVMSKADVNLYKQHQDDIASAVANAIAGMDEDDIRPPPVEPPTPSGALFTAAGTCSTFGGPADQGVSASEGLAMWYKPEECPWLMLGDQPSGTTGMARRLDPAVFYLACRWDYDVTPKEMLRGKQMALVTARDTGVSRLAHVADWGPHEEQTGRAADLSPALAESLGVTTDDEVEVIYPAPA